MTSIASVSSKPGRTERYWTGIKLWKRIFAALLLGAVVGGLAGSAADSLSWMGELFIRLIRMLVVPLVFVIVVTGIAGLGDLRKLSTIGVRTIAYYVMTTVVAVILGLALATAMLPGVGVALGVAHSLGGAAAPSFGTQLVAIIPENPIMALAEGQMMSVIFFAILTGVGLIATGEEAKNVKALFDGTSALMLRLVRGVMELAPFGVFALIAVAVGTGGLTMFASVLKLGFCVLIGAALQTLVVHGSLLRIAARLPLLPFLRGSRDAILIGFSTASSSATLPVAMNVAERKLGIAPAVSSTVLPLGATLSMDGTAMYMAMLAIFGVQALGVALTPADYAILAIAIVTLAMGTAPIPSSSLFLMTAVLGSVGVPAEKAALLVSFILPFDRPLDMIRTIPNVTSDLSVAATVARAEGQLDLDTYLGTGSA